MRKQIGFIGLGKMGMSMAHRLNSNGWEVVVYDINKSAVTTAKRKGMIGVNDPGEMLSKLKKPRTVFLMVPSGKPVDMAIDSLGDVLEKDDVVIDGGNSNFEMSQKRADRLKGKGIHLMDVGISGGPESVKDGVPALMIGGDKKVFMRVRSLFSTITLKESMGYMGPSGSGHFVKMVHNGIEYGMMQSMAEGFTVLKDSKFNIDLKEVARVYNNGSVIQSRLTGWMEKGFKKYGQELKGVSGSVSHTGMGQWTAKTARKLGISVPVIERSYKFRVESERKPSYTGRLLMMLRAMFGGHDADPKN